MLQTLARPQQTRPYSLNCADSGAGICFVAARWRTFVRAHSASPAKTTGNVYKVAAFRLSQACASLAVSSLWARTKLNSADLSGLPRCLPAVASDHADYDYNGNVTLTCVVAEVVAHWTMLQREQETDLGERRARFMRQWVPALDEWHHRYPDTGKSLGIERDANAQINSFTFCSSTGVSYSRSLRFVFPLAWSRQMPSFKLAETWRCRSSELWARGA